LLNIYNYKTVLDYCIGTYSIFFKSNEGLNFINYLIDNFKILNNDNKEKEIKKCNTKNRQNNKQDYIINQKQTILFYKTFSNLQLSNISNYISNTYIENIISKTLSCVYSKSNKSINTLSILERSILIKYIPNQNKYYEISIPFLPRLRNKDLVFVDQWWNYIVHDAFKCNSYKIIDIIIDHTPFFKKKYNMLTFVIHIMNDENEMKLINQNIITYYLEQLIHKLGYNTALQSSLDYALYMGHEKIVYYLLSLKNAKNYISSTILNNKLLTLRDTKLIIEYNYCNIIDLKILNSNYNSNYCKNNIYSNNYNNNNNNDSYIKYIHIIEKIFSLHKNKHYYKYYNDENDYLRDYQQFLSYLNKNN
jgi:hypothetical protein